MMIMKIGRCIRALAAGPALLLATLGGCDTDADACPDGSETCQCTVDYKCLEGLTCLSDRCVDVFWTPPEPSDENDDDDGDDGGGRGDSVDNVAACEAWVQALSDLDCGFADWEQLAGCDAYAGLDCDLAGQGYFDCLTDNTVCSAGAPDVSGWSQCASQATCD